MAHVDTDYIRAISLFNTCVVIVSLAVTVAGSMYAEVRPVLLGRVTAHEAWLPAPPCAGRYGRCGTTEVGWHCIADRVWRTPAAPILLARLVCAGLQAAGLAPVSLWLLYHWQEVHDTGLSTVQEVDARVQQGRWAVLMGMPLAVLAGYASQTVHRAYSAGSSSPVPSLWSTCFWGLPGPLALLLLLAAWGDLYAIAPVLLLSTLFGTCMASLSGCFLARRLHPMPAPAVHEAADRPHVHVVGGEESAHDAQPVPSSSPPSRCTAWCIAHLPWIAAFLPFSVLFLEFHMTLTQLYSGTSGTRIDMVLCMLLALLLVSALLGILAAYIQVRAQQPRWQWYVVRSTSTSGLYLLAWALVQYRARWQAYPELYIGWGQYMALVLGLSWAVAVLTGAVGYVAALLFTKVLYTLLQAKGSLRTQQPDGHSEDSTRLLQP